MVAFWITLPDFDKSLVFIVQFMVPKLPFAVYTHSITVYTPRGGMKALTARQQEVFDLIRDHISQTGMPPTRAEIAQRLGFRSPNAAEEHLKALARKGVIPIVSADHAGFVCCRKRKRIAAGRSCGCR
ncbi:hypothetical protein ACNKHV_26120 [Shigella flexneri]